MNNLKILYEDNHIIVVIKPQNILSQSDITGDIDMLTIIKSYIKEKYNKKGNVYLGLVHRLDKKTSGIMVFARTSKAAKRLQEAIINKTFKKSYLAVIYGKIAKEGHLENYLEKIGTKSIVKENGIGKYASLKYQLLSYDQKKDLSLVKVDLETGRNHQIRLQFSHINHPLYGDNKYGKDKNKNLGLYAYKLEFPHPTTKKILCFTSYPEYLPFTLFKR